ncbi:hypothetical protein CRYUN_Cryun11dG0094200 [Craigia yunnanensis]
MAFAFAQSSSTLSGSPSSAYSSSAWPQPTPKRIKCYDLTWLVRLPSEEGSCCQGSRAVVEDINHQLRVANGNAQRRVDGGTKVSNGLGMQLLIDGRNGPRLQRSRTV